MNRMLDISKLKTGDIFFLVRSYDDFYECEITTEYRESCNVGVIQRDVTGFNRTTNNWLEAHVKDIYYATYEDAAQACQSFLHKARMELKDLRFLLESLHELAFEHIPSKEAELYWEAIEFHLK